MITLTESAVQELKALLEKKGASEESGLRLGVERGGCAGFQYTMQVSEKTEGDKAIEQDGARIFLAADSLEHLRGAQIDYSHDLANSGFKVVNPNATRSCGCGTSFEAKKEGLEPGHDPSLNSTNCC
ncbi:MAG: iron-sulfur cluster assembly accessory protein [Roseibacillus sp.]|jgi:iron-sulfur cluster assembly protein|nr:iron-sulfur cluster assembly accessory protein [Roseibacillus sp.]MBP35339.1 iron-sulfur cluster assembly accessory protein [Roseibacillus sp.]MCP4730543.1 iron-sulfur cluster assembly accessory protein [Roseibacillus sp.]MDP6207396.1 iron-sulfur cluster assembly accessory protein [Roseibacillus sp.]MDP7309135.1 iron-sulfur cluster assembly accessory protein [Roseibacillus sp.]|tara:strand:+ start:12938 stop:13318 length:381 start_codon:yes stop_codon:yes gene_type:complete